MPRDWIKSSLARLYPMERTLKAERQVCKLPSTLMPKEVGHAYCACHSDATDCKVRPAVFQAGVGACAGISSRGAAGARPTHSDCGVAGDGAESPAALSELSSGAESGAMVEFGDSPCAAGAGGGQLRLSKEYERLCESSEAIVYATMARLM